MPITPLSMKSSEYDEIIVPTPQSRALDTSKAREDTWMKFIEASVIFLATWLNPSAGISIFALKLCFQLLEVLRHHHRR
jgi:hypothetical protein